jgi:hypothetical protein
MKEIFKHFIVMLGVNLWFISGGGYSYSQNLPPVIDPVGACYVNEGETLNINIHATDPDGDIIKIWAVNPPPDAVFSDEGTGYLLVLILLQELPLSFSLLPQMKALPLRRR